MGLDMFLTGICSVAEGDGAQASLDHQPFVQNERVEMGSWSRQWELHHEIMERFGVGRDEMQNILLSLNDIDLLLSFLIDELDIVHAAIEANGNVRSEEQLEAECNAEYIKLWSIKIFAKARIWLLAQEPKTQRQIAYSASW